MGRVEVSLENWLSAPTNRSAFRQVNNILDIAEVPNDSAGGTPFEKYLIDPELLNIRGRDETESSIEQYLESTYTDGFLILGQGRILYEWYNSNQSINDKHIVFSVTKSLVGSLAGILVERGILNTEYYVSQYVPELSASGYGQVKLQDLLDMNVNIDFQEAYEDSDSPFAKYREATGWHPLQVKKDSLGMHDFLCQIRAGEKCAEKRFDYLSPNSDVLGWVCESATGSSLSDLISSMIWKPMKAESSAYITLDKSGSPRAAGGFGCTLRDMAKFGECMRNYGRLNGDQIIPESWVKSIVTHGDKDAWNNGLMKNWIPGGAYKNQWWVTGNIQEAYFAAGIYGQWIYISPKNGVVIVKQSSRNQPAASQDDFISELEIFENISEKVAHYGE